MSCGICTPWGSPRVAVGGRDAPRPPWATQAQPGKNCLGSNLDTPNGAFKVGPNAGHRRHQVYDPVDRGLGVVAGALQNAI